MKDLIRSYLRAAGKRGFLMPLILLGKANRAYREGGNLAPDRAVGQRTWESFLAEQLRLPSTGERLRG